MTRIRRDRRSRFGLRAFGALGSVLLLTIALAACGGDDDKKSSDSGGSTGSTVPRPTGAPIKLGNISTITNPVISAKPLVDATQAWIDYINDELGGVANRPLELVTCDDQGQAALSIQCANNLLDQGVVGFVGQWSLAFGANALPTVEQAGAAVFGGLPITPQEWNSPVEFPTTPGAAGNYPVMAIAMRAEGAENIAILSPDTPAAAVTNKQVGDLWPTIGGDDFKAVTFTATAPDFTPAASSVVADNPDGVIIGSGGTTAVRLIQALGNVGYNGMLAATGLILVPEVEEQASAELEGMLFTLPSPLSADSGDFKDQSELYERIMKQNDLPKTQETIIAASGMQYVYDVLKSVSGEIDRTTTLAAAKAMTSWPGFLTHAMSDDFAPEGFSAVRNPYMTVVKYKGQNEDVEPIEIKGFDEYSSEQNGITFISAFKKK